MYFCGRTQPLSDSGLVNALHKVKELGFDGVEICPETKGWDRFRFDSRLIGQVQAAVDELEFAKVSFGLHADYIYDDEMFELTKRLIPVTREFSSDVFIISGCKARQPAGDAQEWNLMMRRTAELVDIAERSVVRIAMEHEPNFIVGSTATQLTLMQEIESRYFGANLDIGHAYVCDPDPVASIDSLSSRLFHMHLENMPKGRHKHLPPYDTSGCVDFKAVFSRLSALGFSGGMALDLYVDDYEEMARRSLQFLRSIADEVEK